MAGRTQYDAYDLRVLTSHNEFITLSSIKLDIPEYLSLEKGILVVEDKEIKGSMKVRAETLKYFAKMAKQARSWAKMPAIDFINMVVAPKWGEPLHIVLKNVRIMLSFPEMEKLEGGGIEVELPFLPGEVLVNGSSIIKPRTPGALSN